jgi:hypothetical protein
MSWLRSVLAAVFVAGALAVSAASFVAPQDPCTEFTCGGIV